MEGWGVESLGDLNGVMFGDWNCWSTRDTVIAFGMIYLMYLILYNPWILGT